MLRATQSLAECPGSSKTLALLDPTGGTHAGFGILEVTHARTHARARADARAHTSAARTQATLRGFSRHVRCLLHVATSHVAICALQPSDATFFAAGAAVAKTYGYELPPEFDALYIP